MISFTKDQIIFIAKREKSSTFKFDLSVIVQVPGGMKVAVYTMYLSLMEKKYFSSLDKLQKIDFIWNYGEIINELEDGHHYNSLFVLADFFVEVKLHKLSNEIISIAVQEDREALFSYVKKIDLRLLQHG